MDIYSLAAAKKWTVVAEIRGTAIGRIFTQPEGLPGIIFWLRIDNTFYILFEPEPITGEGKS